MPDRPLIPTDIQAVQAAVQALTDVDITVLAIDTVDREESEDGRVRWTLTCEADTRTQSLEDFGFGGEGDE